MTGGVRMLSGDIDGTILFDRAISPADVAAMRRWRAAGNLLVMNTGRSISALRSALAGFDVDYDKMTAEQQSVKTVFNDWDMMGARWSEFGVDNPRVEVTAGSCTQGAEPPSGKDSEGSPTVTCRLDFTNDAGGAPDKTMGLFYLQRNEDGSWTIVGYLRQYM